jgi:hypothetical protein
VSADSLAAVWVAVITAIVAPTWLGYWNSRKHRKTLDEISDAVNHRHRKAAGSPALYDAVLELVEWRRRWDDLPVGMDDSAGLAERFTRIDTALRQNVVEHDQIIHMIEERHPL